MAFEALTTPWGFLVSCAFLVYMPPPIHRRSVCTYRFAQFEAGPIQRQRLLGRAIDPKVTAICVNNEQEANTETGGMSRPVASFCSRTRMAKDTSPNIHPKSRQLSGSVFRAASISFDDELHLIGSAIGP